MERNFVHNLGAQLETSIGQNVFVFGHKMTECSSFCFW